MWQLIDHTGTNSGYLRITKDGKRVADVFPFAKDADAEWVRSQAVHLVEQMNLVEMTQVGEPGVR